jgi:outer membrane protein OmpA-like peptidoglycan-associated protein
MRKYCFFVLVLSMILTMPGYSQTEEKGDFFLSGGLYYGIFGDSVLPVIPEHRLRDYLNVAKLGGAWEWPFKSGYAAIGLEAGYASGSRFGGKGSIDFLPITLNASYAFPFTSFFSVGPSLKLGAFGFLGDGWTKFVPLVGARLEAELRNPFFPVSLYGSGGADLFPTALEFSALPVLEVGVRLRRANRPDAFIKKEEDSIQGSPKKDPETVPGSQGFSQAGGTQATQPDQSGQITPAVAQEQATVTGTPQQQPPAGAQNQGEQTPGIAQGQQPAAGQQPQRPDALNQDEQGRIVTLENGQQGLLRSVYFEPDTANLIESYRSILEIVGRELTANPNQQVLLRAYAAHLKTVEGQQAVSVDRARFCRDYLMQRHGIAPGRINSEAYGGSEREPLAATSDWESYRCVELIITGR